MVLFFEFVVHIVSVIFAVVDPERSIRERRVIIRLGSIGNTLVNTSKASIYIYIKEKEIGVL